jgi:uncharacterized peroxidase-related enzyme
MSERMDFTTDALDWSPWIEPVDLAQATPEQRASLSETPSNMKVSAYSLVLAHDPAALSERSPLFNKIMYAPRGLPRAERELSTLVESVLNGCVYCASVHARRFIELAKAPDVVAAIYGGTNPALEPRRAAIVAFALALSHTPSRATRAQVADLRAVGLSELEILDLINAVAMFAWANRLMQTLGEPALPV